jgi:3-oxoacid CoA-transferase subunit B
MKMRLDEQTIALRVAREFKDGDYVNLGAGIPYLASNLVPEGKNVIFQFENGIIGFGHTTTLEEADWDVVGAGGSPVARRPGMSFFDAALSFTMIRGGHLDLAVLGALQVSEKGDLANIRPKLGIPANIGGAMDFIGTRKIIVAMHHNTPDGKPKIVKECTLEITIKKCVSLIITDIAVIEVTPNGLLLKEVAPGFTAEEVQSFTAPKLMIDSNLREIEL